MKFEKDKDYYENKIDKRTKEYKEYKDYVEKQPKGLGDVIAKVTEATGVDVLADNIAKKLGYKDCGCEERKEKLNKVFRFRTPDCLTEDEFIYLAEFFDVSRTRVTHDEQLALFSIYNRVFYAAMKPTSCGSCYREVENKMKRLIREYKK